MQSARTLCLMTMTLALSALSSTSARADEATPKSSRLNQTLEVYNPNHYDSFMRVTILGGASLPDSSAEKPTPAPGGGVYVDFGTGMFTFEAGVQYLGIPGKVQISGTDPAAATTAVSITSQFVGIPLVLKYNYIEQPQASFSLKVGAMPAMMINNQDMITTTDATQTTSSGLTLNQMEYLAIAGFTGTAPIADSTAFVIDGTYYYGLTKIDESGSRNQAAAFSVGLRFSL